MLRRLRTDQRGLALIEFAFSAPLLLAVSCYGLEMGNVAITRMQMSQMSLSVADNISRVGASTSLNVTQIRETDVVDSLAAAKDQTPDIFANGRVIISSLQQNASGGQWIAWQRCRGTKNAGSQFGVEGTGSTGTAFAGMGPTNAVVKAPPSSAVMYVEISYNYQPLFPVFWGDTTSAVFFSSTVFNNSAKTVKYNASFIVRDKRELAQNDTNGNIVNGKTGITNPNNPLTGQPAPKLDCTSYTS